MVNLVQVSLIRSVAYTLTTDFQNLNFRLTVMKVAESGILKIENPAKIGQYVRPGAQVL